LLDIVPKPHKVTSFVNAQTLKRQCLTVQGPTHTPPRCIWYLRTPVLQFTFMIEMQSSIFGDIMPCSPVKVNWHFGETSHLYLQGWRLCQARNHHEAGSKQLCLHHADFHEYVGIHISIILLVFHTPCAYIFQI
jgi:hypothetical protein